MQDTSFAIHPGNKKKLEHTTFHDIGNVKSVNQKEHITVIEAEEGFVNILFYRQDIVRVVMNPHNPPELEGSYAVDVEPRVVDLSFEENDQEITLSSKSLIVRVQKQPLRISVLDVDGNNLVSETEKGMGYNNEGHVVCFKEANQDDHYYGFGEKTGFLDKRGEKYTMWNSDVYAPHNPETDPLYESIPFFMTLRQGRATGIFFDNTFKTTFDMRIEQSETYSFKAEGGQIDYYICAGPTPKDVLEQYTELTGRMPLPPKWGLGYHQSRYSYETEAEVRELVNHFIEKEIPVDAIHFDIHYMNGYRVFTFDHDRFPDPKGLISDMKEKGIRTVPIVDPGVKVDAEYSTYVEGVTNDLFCKYVEGNIFYGDVWPGKSAFPDFTKDETREWWGKKHSFYTDKGIEGIWNDMNEPAVFNETKTMDLEVMHDNDGNPKTHRELHNIYGLLMGEATYDGMKELLNGKRPFLLTRAGYAGVQKYAAVWTGDNRSFWEHLEMAIPMCLNLGVSGVTYTGPDVGGFAHDSNGELLTRWTQFGAFTPFFRNHSAIEFAYQEPWQFGEKYEEVVKKYIQLRYKWLPHIYKLFKDASETGVPVMRPLFFEYSNDEETYQLSDQFLIGSNVLIAPILRPGVKDRVVYLPEGVWYDYWTGEKFEGGKRMIAHAELDTLPIYVKRGAIIPEANVKPSTLHAVDEMTVHIYPSEDEVSYQLYDDDGETFEYQDKQFFALDIVVQRDDDRVVIDTSLVNNQYQPKWQEITYKVHGISSDVQVVYNGEKIKDAAEHEGYVSFVKSW
ncbi:glycoside hydrolase family 31 protein [Filobacillus milosensis]|uniref:Glycoside hydrolase family 31 protein n=1 Tax=Filobacillus milosensis TaxID=94137 RepID=A0A4Y8ITR0_9BACI|nr:glycoside hydrolase family 31 protein [Filobacillus milosensis]TFB24452.1 glycoside hydrolase family 31 protein [Filobacillus milosensis]